MIPRPGHEAHLRRLLSQFPVVGLVGARQVGKTTLARSLGAREQGRVTFFDLEDPTDEARFADPKLALESLDGLVVIDEVQHSPGLFRLLSGACGPGLRIVRGSWCWAVPAPCCSGRRRSPSRAESPTTS